MTPAEFIDTMFGATDHNVNLRAIDSTKKLPTKESFTRGSAGVLQFADQYRDHYNIYFGVATRNGGGGKEHIREIVAVHADIDFKATPREAALKLLSSFPLSPTFVVETGGGFHVYWMLCEPSGPEDIPAVEAINRGLAKALGGDKAACDASRILRVPGTWNRKAEYGEPRPVQVIEAQPERRYNLSDFSDFAEETKPPTPAQSHTSPGALLPIDHLSRVVERCEAVARILKRAKAEKHLSHPERIALANLYMVFEGGQERAVEKVFSNLSDFDAEYTAKMFASLCGKPPVCMNEGLCSGKDRCAPILEAGGNSPVKFAYADPSPAVEPPRGEETRPAPRVTVLEDLKPRSLRDLLSDPSLTEPEPVLEGILGVGELAVLGGPPKAMKSWTVKSIALSLAAAQPWLGFEVGRPFRALYLSAEGRECRLKERFQKMIAFSPDMEDETFDRIEVLSTGGKLKLDTDAGEDAFLRIIEPFEVIIADPFYRFIATGDENSHKDARRVQDLFDRVKDGGKTVVLVHHLRKPQGTDSGISELRGAGMDGFADAIFILQRKREQSDDRFSLRFTTRNYEDPPDMELRRDGVLLVPVDDSERKVSRLDVMSALTLAGKEMTGSELIVALEEMTHAGERTIKRAIGDAVAWKTVVWKPLPGRGRGRIYSIPEGGL